VNRPLHVETMNKAIVILKEKQTDEKIEFVSGKRKRKTELQKAIETMEEFLEKQTKYDRYNELFAGINSFSKTDKVWLRNKSGCLVL
jgi:hypothetical protein